MVRKSYNSGSYVAYTYNAEGSLARLSYGDSTGELASYRFEYDSLGRLTRSEVALNDSAIYTTAYAFRDLDASRTTTQVQYRNVRSANGKMLEGKKYTYDALGNITRISQSTSPFHALVDYEYDAQNQLVKETYYNGNGTSEGNITRTISYTYDTAGNILSETKTVGSKTTTKTFSYTDSNWKDLLTGIDDQKLVYDASGNPTTYRNGTSVYYDMEWVNGRQLSFVECYYGSQSRSYYSYDASGIRSEKIVEMPGEVISYSYITQSGKVIRETVDDDHSIAILDFIYDESGKPFAMIDQLSAQPKTYYYVLNLQGDVVKPIDQDGAEVAAYTYDAWGNILS